MPDWANCRGLGKFNCQCMCVFNAFQHIWHVWMLCVHVCVRVRVDICQKSCSKCGQRFISAVLDLLHWTTQYAIFHTALHFCHTSQCNRRWQDKKVTNPAKKWALNISELYAVSLSCTASHSGACKVNAWHRAQWKPCHEDNRLWGNCVFSRLQAYFIGVCIYLRFASGIMTDAFAQMAKIHANWRRSNKKCVASMI